MEPQQELPQQLPGIQRAVLLVIVLVGVLQDGVQILRNGPVLRPHGREVRLVRNAPFPVQLLQHQLQGIDLLVGEGLVGPEKVLEEGDVLGQGRFLLECLWRVWIVLSIHIPPLGLQEVDAVLPAHEVCVTAAQLVAEPGQLLLRVQADHRLAALQQVADEQLEQVAFALARVAQDEHAGVGLVRCAAVQIQQDIRTIVVIADVEPMGIAAAGVVDGVQVGGGAGGQHPLKLGAQGVAAHRVGGEEAFPLTEEQRICTELGPGELGAHLIPQPPQLLGGFGGQLQEHRAVDEGLPVLPGGGNDGSHVLEVGLRRDTPLQVILIAPIQPELVDGLVVDSLLLRHCHLTGIEVEGDTGPVADVGEQGQLLSDGGVAPEGQDAAVQPAQHIGVCVELDRRRGDPIQEVLGLEELRWFFRRFLLLLLTFSHARLPTSLHLCCQSVRSPCPAGSTPPADA